eukprot:CAMPEP_0175417732 /NCGR_PEP_ID=MMETSP0095-20121207/45348_1 /TAXON_ID=311494 /ORGANISM="Alexandrium monilatum, Strain CCMP3105" /LENGTH=156 /DNA_ID=CAMNT_0016716867 /DNA_START=117 /DNA_END=587 /DNA_ORIENTATION=+
MDVVLPRAGSRTHDLALDPIAGVRALQYCHLRKLSWLELDLEGGLLLRVRRWLRLREVEHGGIAGIDIRHISQPTTLRSLCHGASLPFIKGQREGSRDAAKGSRGRVGAGRNLAAEVVGPENWLVELWVREHSQWDLEGTEVGPARLLRSNKGDPL